MPWHETLPNRLVGHWIPPAIIFARSFDAPLFFSIIWIMYLYVLQNVAKNETRCSHPPNRKERQALKKSLVAKRYWVKSTLGNKYAPSLQITRQHRREGNESSPFFLHRGLGLTLFGVLSAQAGEREANRLLVVVAMETGRDKRPQKWRNKMTSKD